MKSNRGVTLIELIVVMAVLALLVALALPRLMGYTQEANRTRLINDAKVLEDACHRYYMDHGDWPRASDESFTAEEVADFAERVLNTAGEVVELNPEGKYYDLDMTALAPYVRINTDSLCFVLQNPAGSVYALENSKRESESAPFTILIGPDTEILTITEVTFDIQEEVEAVEWQIDDGEIAAEAPAGFYPEGAHVVRARVRMNGEWSDWYSKKFVVKKCPKVVQIAPALEHTLALLEDGRVLSWGWNGWGQLGLGNSEPTQRFRPDFVPSLTNVKKIFAGRGQSFALLEDGTVMVWGNNLVGQLGLGDTEHRYSPTVNPSLQGVVDIVVGHNFCFALREDGRVLAWGLNDYGQLGLGDKENRYVPCESPLTNVQSISAGTDSALAVLSNGMLYGWGRNAYGQLGVGDKLPRLMPTMIDVNYHRVVQAAIGSHTSGALLSNGEMMMWGTNYEGALGRGTSQEFSDLYPKTYVLDNIQKLVITGTHCYAIEDDGSLRVWGSNRYNALGLNGMRQRVLIPENLYGSGMVKDLYVWNNFAFALMQDGTIMAWGYNGNGQLGNGSSTDSPYGVEPFILENLEH